MLKKYGKRIPTLSEYSSMLLPMDEGRDNEELGPTGIVTSGRSDEYYLVQTSDNGYRMMPGPELSPRLYRGQTKRFSPCKPGLFRGLYRYEDCIYWWIKQFELGYLMSGHPAVQDMLQWDFDGLKFDFNMQAVAQHYQYPTQMIDLSRSRDIAMYFATHEFPEGVKSAKPAIGSRAILYSVDLAYLLSNGSTGRGLLPLGIDPMPRAAAQRAFALELDIKENFEELPGVYIDEFQVTEEIAQEYDEKVGGVEALFPYDPFERCIDELGQNNVISRAAIEIAVKSGKMPLGYDMEQLTAWLSRGGYKIVDSNPSLPSKEILHSASNEWGSRRSEFLKMIRFRGVSDHINLQA